MCIVSAYTTWLAAVKSQLDLLVDHLALSSLIISNCKPVETMKQIPNFYNTALLYDYLQNHNCLLVQQSKHLSILTDVLYEKEPSLCINLLFLALSLFFFFLLNTSMAAVICFWLICCYVGFCFFHMVPWGGGAGPPALERGPGEQREPCLCSSAAPPGPVAIPQRLRADGQVYVVLSRLPLILGEVI